MKGLYILEKYFILFFIGGTAYFYLEIIARGYSHISMFVCGGICFLGCGMWKEILPGRMGMLLQMLCSSIFITITELITGLIVNVWLEQNVWDYSILPLNFMGQICLFYSILWFFLSAAAIYLNDFLKLWLFGEEMPQYHL